MKVWGTVGATVVAGAAVIINGAVDFGAIATVGMAFGSVVGGVVAFAAAPVALPLVGLSVPAGVLGGLALGTHDQAHELGKGFETWFEHAMGLTGDTEGLLG